MAQASRSVQPSADFISMLRQVPFMGDRELAALTSSPAFGSLALTEISKRERMRLMSEAKKQAMTAGKEDETIADKKLASLAQQKFMDKLAADDRMGLNNLVAQAEQGALEFGEPVEVAGGGMIAFDRGGEVPGYAVGALIPLAARALSMYGPRILPKLGMEAGKRGIGALKAHPYITAGVGTAAGIPFGLDALGDDEEGFSSEELQKQYEAQDRQEGRPKVDRDITRGAGRGEGAGAGRRSGTSGLDLDTDVESILRKRRELEKEAGLGEFGAKAKEIRESRKKKLEETFGKALDSEVLSAGSEAAGKARPTGRRGLVGLLDVAAPTLSAMSKAASNVQRQKTEALDKLAESEERFALAQEQYMRGDIKDAETQARAAKKDIFTANNQLRGLDLKEKQIEYLGLAARARAAGGGGPRIDPVKATMELNSFQQQLSDLDPKDPKNKIRIAELQTNIRMLRGLIGMSIARGTGASIEDTED